MDLIKLMNLYDVLVDMINDKRIGIMEATSILEKAGLTSDDNVNWRTEDGRVVTFPEEFPAFDLDKSFSRNNPDPYTISNGVDPYVGC